MAVVVEILGALASVITIFSAGFAVGRYIGNKKNRPASHED